MKILLKPVPWEEAARFLEGKPAVLRRVFDRMVPEIRARAFTVAEVERVSALQDIRGAIAKLPRGARWEDVKKDVLAKLGPHAPAGDTPEDLRKAELAAARHAELILRSNGFVCASAAQHQALAEDREVFPALRYNAFHDSRTRDSHAALDGLVLPADDPFWRDHTPPWEWGCRCWLTPATLKALNEARAGRGGWSPGPEAMKRFQRTGMLDKGDGHPFPAWSPRRRAEAEGRDPNLEWWWNPGDLRLPLASLRARYDDEAWTAFRRAMERANIETPASGRGTIWDWLLEPSLKEAGDRALTFGSETGRELLVSVDYSSGKILTTTDGTIDQVAVREALQAARKNNTRIVLVHNHPGGGMLSPRDVIELIGQRETVERVEAVSQWYRNSVRVAPGNDKPERILNDLKKFNSRAKARTLSEAEWEKYLLGVSERGLLLYEQTVRLQL